MLNRNQSDLPEAIALALALAVVFAVAQRSHEGWRATPAHDLRVGASVSPAEYYEFRPTPAGAELPTD